MQALPRMRRRPGARRSVARSFAALAMLGILTMQAMPAIAATIETDLWVYENGDTVTVFGDGFAPFETVELVTTTPLRTEIDRGTIPTDSTGSLTYRFILNTTETGIFDVVATGHSSGLSAATQFDPNKAVFHSSAFSAPSSVSPGQVFTVSASFVGDVNQGAPKTSSVTLSFTGGFSVAAPATRSVTVSNSTNVQGASWSVTAPTSGSGTGTITLAAGPDARSFSVTVTPPSDTTPPVITKTVTGTAGANGWYTSNVQVGWVVSDPQSAVAIVAGCGTQSFGTETTGLTSTCQASSAGGTSSDSFALKIDKTGPSASLAVADGTPGLNGWYTSDATISTLGSDGISGGVSCSADQELTEDSVGTTFQGSCTNAAGLTTQAAPLVVKRDATPPTLERNVTPAANGFGWHKATLVSVTYSCDDETSGIDPSSIPPDGCPDEDTRSAEGEHLVAGPSVRDKAGNLTSLSDIDVRIDRTPPTIVQGAITGTLGSNGWYLSPVSVAFSASDDGSGLEDPSDASFELVADDEGAGVETDARTASDVAGNSADAGPLALDIDRSDPVLECETPASGWSADDISVDCTASDDVSGLADPNDRSFSLSTAVAAAEETDEATIAAYEVCDVAGRCVTVGPWADLKVDKKAPEVACGTADEDWHATDVTIDCTAADGGSGVSLEDGSFSLTTDVADGIETDSASTGTREVCDGVGNCATAGPVEGNKVDKKAPELVGCDSPDGDWHADNVTLTCTYTDGGSGPASQTVELTTAVDAGEETADAVASADGDQACDGVGNCAGTPDDIAGNKVDRKGPVITITRPSSSGGFLLNEDVAADYRCADGGSGSDSCTGPVVPGSALDTFTTGTRWFRVDATDAVGNTSSLSHSYVVRYGAVCADGPGRQVLQPVDKDGMSVFKRGSTVPVKFRVCDARGVSMGGGSVFGTGPQPAALVGGPFNYPVLSKKITGSGQVDEVIVSTTPDTEFRWDVTGRQWIFNLNTKNLTAGQTYHYVIYLSDGTSVPFSFGLR